MGQKMGSKHPAKNTAPSAMRLLAVITIFIYCVVLPVLWPPITVSIPECLWHFWSILLRTAELWNPLPHTSASPFDLDVTHLMEMSLFAMSLGGPWRHKQRSHFSLSPQYLAHFQNMVLWSLSICWTNDYFCLVPTLSVGSRSIRWIKFWLWWELIMESSEGIIITFSQKSFQI